jgi:hypothetical protein
LAQARKQALIVQSMSNMRQLVMGCTIYAEDNKGEWPDNLDLITAKYLGGRKDLLADPQHPEMKSAYTYIKPSKAQMNQKPSQTIVLYESADPKSEFVSGGFADGHVEKMTRAQFEKALLDSQAGNADNGL